jgi:anti-anti-sigma factor
MYMGRVFTRRETVVALPEEIDLLNATRVAEQLTSAVRRNPAVIIDMTATTFCDCAGARAIVQAHKRARQRRRAAPGGNRGAGTAHIRPVGDRSSA